MKTTDINMIVKSCEYWVKNHEGEDLPLAYSSVVELLNVLKEHEPVKAIPTRLKVVRTYNDVEYNYCCGGCNSYLLDRWVACPICGKMVKWE